MLRENIDSSLPNMSDITHRCPYCNFTFTDLADLENHLKEEHYLTMQAYYELEELRTIAPETCYKCGKDRTPLTYYLPGGYYLPCWDCLTNKFERSQNTTIILSAIKNYFSKLVNDRYLQMFLVSDMYFTWTLSHTYDEFKEVLKNLEKYNRSKIWFLDWIPGYPKTICLDNIDGIQVKLIDDWYSVESEPGEIKINSWKVIMPEIIPFDQRHHSRYNLLNLAADPKGTKRLRLKGVGEGDTCVKLFNNGEMKSLFQIVDLEGNPVERLSEQDLTVTKLVLMRNKPFMKLIWSVLEEILSTSCIFSDSAFLRNTITINPDERSGIKLNFSWDPSNYKETYNINLSIL